MGLPRLLAAPVRRGRCPASRAPHGGRAAGAASELVPPWLVVRTGTASTRPNRVPTGRGQTPGARRPFASGWRCPRVVGRWPPDRPPPAGPRATPPAGQGLCLAPGWVELGVGVLARSHPSAGSRGAPAPRRGGWRSSAGVGEPPRPTAPRRLSGCSLVVATLPPPW